MPKLKTHKGSQRRFYITGGGKYMRRKGQISHNRRKLRGETSRLVSRKLSVHKGAYKRLDRLLPYGSR